MSGFDASVVGAGPNGLAAAVALAREDRKVLLVEGMDQIGGGTRTEELTLPGFRHDTCSAIHPTALASPFFNEIDLGVEWITPSIAFTHPLGDGRVAAFYNDVDETASELGEDSAKWRGLMGPLVENVDLLAEDVLSPLTVNPKHKAVFARIAAIGGLPAALLSKRFETDEAKALIAGLAGHAIAPFNAPATAAVGLMLGVIGHASGWPLARGGSQAIADALATRLTELGGVIETGRWVESINDLEGATTLLDVMPPAAYRIASERVTTASARRLQRWKPGPGVFKVDWALDGPVPWADELSSQTATVHLGGTYEEVEAAENSVFKGVHPEKPFVLFAQQSLFDDSRAPEGKHTAWGYCHVPEGSTVDMTDAIEAQVERFAPGFRNLILARATKGPADYEAYNPNNVGGDIGGGSFGLKKVMQMGTKRPYALGGNVFLCSSATPPGAGVHGMCGYHAARAALA